MRGSDTHGRDVQLAWRALGVEPGDPYYIVHPDALKMGDAVLARSSDPETSKKAARAVLPKLKNQQGELLKYLASIAPLGITGPELKYLRENGRAPVKGSCPWHRLSDLGKAIDVHGNPCPCIDYRGERAAPDSGSTGAIGFINERGYARLRQMEAEA